MKEKIKSLILIILIIGSIMLTMNTWTKERLWPEGYSLFMTVKNWPLIRHIFSSQKHSEPLENLSRARKLVIADGEGSSAVYYNTDSAFDDVYDDIKALFCSYLKGELSYTQSTLSKEDLRTILGGQIVYAYINYPISYTPKLFGQVMDVPNTNGLSELVSMKDFFVIPVSDTQLALLAVDNTNDKIERYEFFYENTDNLTQKFKASVANADPADNCMLSLELNMDIQNSDDIIKTPVLLDSFVVLDTASTADVTTRRITSINPLSSDIFGLNNNQTLDRVVQMFNFTPQSIYRYVDSSGTIIYLDNNSTLKIYKNGLISYNTINPGRGIRVIDSSAALSVYESLNAAISFTEDIWEITSPDAPFNASVSSDLHEQTFTNGSFTFDYYYEGIPVVTQITTNEYSLNHAVEITMSNGIITSFNMLLRNYESTDLYVNNSTIYQALDRIILSSTNEGVAEDAAVYVDDIFLCYPEDATTNSLGAEWAVDIDNSTSLIGG